MLIFEVSNVALISTFSFTVIVDKLFLLIVNSAFDIGSFKAIFPCFVCSANSVFPITLAFISLNDLISSLLYPFSPFIDFSTYIFNVPSVVGALVFNVNLFKSKSLQSNVYKPSFKLCLFIVPTFSRFGLNISIYPSVPKILLNTFSETLILVV